MSVKQASLIREEINTLVEQYNEIVGTVGYNISVV
jgi:hypothetical protein